MKRLTTYLNEKLRINKNFKGIDFEEIIDKEKSHLFKNVSLDSDRLHINSIYSTIKWGSFHDSIVDIDPDYVERCLADNDLYDKDCDAMYIPQIDYTYIKEIDTDSLEKYDGGPFVTDKENYDIYFTRTKKYFLLRIVTQKTHVTADFISVL